MSIVPEVCWMFDADLSAEAVAALVCMDSAQWAVVAMVSQGRDEPCQ